MSKLINFIDSERILNGYTNDQSATVETLAGLLEDLKKGNAVLPTITKLLVFTNRFAFSFILKDGKIIASKQCENCSLYNGKPIQPNIIDHQNPFFIVINGKAKKLNQDTMNRLNSRIDNNQSTVVIYKDFEQVRNADEFVYDTEKNEYIVYTDKIFDKPKPKFDNNREGYYIVYQVGNDLKFAFGNTRSVDPNAVLYRGFDTFIAANKRYKQFCEEVLK
jgi:hypothetical protein